MAQNTSRRVLILIAFALFLATLLVAVIAIKPLPFLIWNASNSVPIGWYWVDKHQPRIGEIAIIRPPDWVRLYASSRGYLPNDVWLLKPIFAVSGTTVCRFGIFIFVDGNLGARAKKWDRQHRILPMWNGCHMLQSDDVFVLARPKSSFDSRYFGPIKRDRVIGTAKRLQVGSSEEVSTEPFRILSF